MVLAAENGIFNDVIIEDDTFVEVRQHTQRQNVAEEIQRLQLLERCRKCAAVRATSSLRRIFDTGTQSAGNAASANVAFADIESSVYKLRRRELPILPTDANDVAPRIRGTCFEMCNDQQFSWTSKHF